MTIRVGAQVGPYAVTASIGKGGMGEVYRARDTKLKRDVALKVLPDAFARDAERVLRFRREAQVLAALNHPNIAAIYGLEESTDATALVMELVEGETLSGPFPIETALHYSRQIADALEAAHEKGIIHRDLKPANIKVTPDGVVKVLDFGLAAIQQLSRDGSDGDPHNSPTLTAGASQAGVIMGTAAYMSPEQAAGKPVDKRSDIWSYGVVFFELLTGRRLFEGGETVSHTLADVLRAPIDLDRLPGDTPSAIRNLLSRCLDRDVKSRLRDIGEARIAIENAVKNPEPPRDARPERVRSAPWIVAAAMIAVIAAVAAGFGWWRSTPPVDRPLMRFTADLGADVDISSFSGPAIAISPDGQRLAYVSRGSDGRTYLSTRLLESPTSTVLAGTEGASAPSFSPDGRWIAFFSDQKLKKISVEGRSPVTLCEVGAARGVFWGEDGNILFANGGTTHLMRVSSSGGKPSLVTELDKGKGEITHRFAQLLPGGEAFLFTASPNNGSYENATIQVQTIKTGGRKTLIDGGYFGRYVATTAKTGYLLFVREAMVFAAPMNLERLEVTGPASPVVENVSWTTSGFAQLDIAQTGTLIYVAGSRNLRHWSLARVDASGHTEVAPAAPSQYQHVSVSLDGKRIALQIATYLSVYEWHTNRMTRLTFKGYGASPIWASDGKHIAFRVSTNDWAGPGIYWTRADGASEPVRLQEGGAPSSFSPDGKRLAYTSGDGIWTLPLDLKDPDRPEPGKAELFLESKSPLQTPHFSPDGRWIAYTSRETQPPQVFVSPFPATASGSRGKWQISTDGGTSPRWSRNGRELFYRGLEGGPRVATYTTTGDSFVASPPRLWSEKWPETVTALTVDPDLMPDGKHFLVVLPTSDASPERQTHVTFLLNFSDELRRRVPIGR
jgi:serine/threonine-protein kinase